LNGRGGEAADVVSRQSAMKPGMEE